MSLCACNESYQCADCVRAELKDLCSERDRYKVECRTLSTELVNCQQDRDNAHAELTNAKATISRLEDEIIELNIFHEMDKET